jgi:hypothetical protein
VGLRLSDAQELGGASHNGVLAGSGVPPGVDQAGVVMQDATIHEYQSDCLWRSLETRLWCLPAPKCRLEGFVCVYPELRSGMGYSQAVSAVCAQLRPGRLGEQCSGCPYCMRIASPVKDKMSADLGIPSANFSRFCRARTGRCVSRPCWPRRCREVLPTGARAWPDAAVVSCLDFLPRAP